MKVPAVLLGLARPRLVAVCLTNRGLDLTSDQG